MLGLAMVDVTMFMLCSVTVYVDKYSKYSLHPTFVYVYLGTTTSEATRYHKHARVGV